jgi:hypothetical protein
MKTNKKKPKVKEYCHECQLDRGGKVPSFGHIGITVHAGKCATCKRDTMLVPSSDYDWPKIGRKAVWD